YTHEKAIDVIYIDPPTILPTMISFTMTDT
ncbi:unnamed protein product, partial [marine sediment metagenome]